MQIDICHLLRYARTQHDFRHLKANDKQSHCRFEQKETNYNWNLTREQNELKSNLMSHTLWNTKQINQITSTTVNFS